MPSSIGDVTLLMQSSKMRSSISGGKLDVSNAALVTLWCSRGSFWQSLLRSPVTNPPLTSGHIEHAFIPSRIWSPSRGRGCGCISPFTTLLTQGHPMGRLLRPVDIAATVGHLLSDASAMITGTIVDLHPESVSGNVVSCAIRATH